MVDMEKDFTAVMARDRAAAEEYLSQVFAAEARYADLQEAMEYSLLSGGKRILFISCRNMIDRGLILMP